MRRAGEVRTSKVYILFETGAIMGDSVGCTITGIMVGGSVVLIGDPVGAGGVELSIVGDGVGGVIDGGAGEGNGLDHRAIVGNHLLKLTRRRIGIVATHNDAATSVVMKVGTRTCGAGTLIGGERIRAAGWYVWGITHQLTHDSRAE